jgi:hypothetical protein
VERFDAGQMNQQIAAALRGVSGRWSGGAGPERHRGEAGLLSKGEVQIASQRVSVRDHADGLLVPVVAALGE